MKPLLFLALIATLSVSPSAAFADAPVASPTIIGADQPIDLGTYAVVGTPRPRATSANFARATARDRHVARVMAPHHRSLFRDVAPARWLGARPLW